MKVQLASAKKRVSADHAIKFQFLLTLVKNTTVEIHFLIVITLITPEIVKAV